MSLPICTSKHRCSDGGEGECSQAMGHYGRHLCGSCLGFFSGGEAIRSDQRADRSSPEPAGQQPRAPQSGGPHVGTLEANCAHCPANSAEPWPWKKCEYCGNQLCPTCTSATCPLIVGTCAHCPQKLTKDMAVGRCGFCANILCSKCKDKPGCPNPQVVCGHCGWAVQLAEVVHCSCGVPSHADCRRACELGKDHYRNVAGSKDPRQAAQKPEDAELGKAHPLGDKDGDQFHS